MKKILSTVLALCMILGCIAVGFTAQAAPLGDDLQAAINAAIAGSGECNWTRGDVELTKPLTINGDVTINFNGATILGAPHMNTIVISGGNVELINADVEGRGAQYHYINAFIEEVEKACPTILIGDANVTLTDFIVTGAYIRIVGTHPQTGEKIPMSDAITMGNANANLTLQTVRAFGNNGVENLYGSKVHVVDCLVGGYINDFYSDANVTYENGTTQKSGYQLFEEVLADYITLTPGESELISKVLGRWLEVTASFKNQTYVAPTMENGGIVYNADTDKLTITAKADKSYDVQSKCAFDYYYIPRTVTLKANGDEIEKTFDQVNRLTYTATFDNVPGDTQCDFDVIYKLAVGMDGDAQSKIDDAISAVEAVINSLPAVIEKFDGEIDEFIDTYLTGNQGIASIIWNLYADDTNISDTPGVTVTAYDAFLASFPEEERAAVDAEVKEFLGILFDICGIDLMATLDKYKNGTLGPAITAVRNGTPTNNQKTEVMGRTRSANDSYGCSLDWDVVNGGVAVRDIGKGIVGKFLDYWDNVKNYAVDNGEFNDIYGLGYYIGENYETFYNDFLKGDVKPVLEKVASILADEDNYVVKLLAQAGGAFDLSSVGDISGYITMAFDYADSIFETGTYKSIIRTFGDQVPNKCGEYLEKAYTIATNLDTYFVLETDGTLIEGFEFPQTAACRTPVDEDMVKVTVQISGTGAYSVNGKQETSTQYYYVPQGGTFEVTPVDELVVTDPETNEEIGTIDCVFNYFAISDPNGNYRLSPTGGNLTVYSNTIITLFFSAPVEDEETPIYDVVFMTNYEMSTTWINTLHPGAVNALPAAPDYTGATFLGWSDQNVSGNAAQQAGLIKSNADIIAAANSATSNVIFYAIYKFDAMVVDNALLNNNVLTMTESFVNDHAAYFTVLISDRPLANGDVIVEAGVLAAASAETIEGATPDGGAGIAKGNLDLNVYTLPAFYTQRIFFFDHSIDKTAYAKGFVTIRHADGTFSTMYTNVQSQLLAAY